MESTKFLADPVRLFHLAEATIRALAERHVDLRTDEARLRAAMAWAQYTRDCHLAMVEAAEHSLIARRLLPSARRNRIRAEGHLRVCLAPLVRAKYELMKNEDLLSVPGFALSMIP